jgi:hypothetical protein
MRPLADVFVHDLRRNALCISAFEVRSEMPGITCCSDDHHGDRDILLETALSIVARCVLDVRIKGGDDVAAVRRIGEVLALVGLPADDLQAFGSGR